MFGVTELLTWREQRRPFRFLTFSLSPTRTYKIGGTIPDWVFQRSNLEKKSITHYHLSKTKKKDGNVQTWWVAEVEILWEAWKQLPPLPDDQIFHWQWCDPNINIARIAKTTLQKCLGKSSLKVGNVFLSVLLSRLSCCPICPICTFCPVCPVWSVSPVLVAKDFSK